MNDYNQHGGRCAVDGLPSVVTIASITTILIKCDQCHTSPYHGYYLYAQITFVMGALTEWHTKGSHTLKRFLGNDESQVIQESRATVSFCTKIVPNSVIFT